VPSCETLGLAQTFLVPVLSHCRFACFQNQNHACARCEVVPGHVRMERSAWLRCPLNHCCSQIETNGSIKKRWDAEHQGRTANDADNPSFLVRDARLSVEFQREVLQTRSHPRLFRGIRGALSRSSPYHLRSRQNATALPSAGSYPPLVRIRHIAS